MNKSSKNIVAVIVLFIMIICLFFTFKAIKPSRVDMLDNIPSNFDNKSFDFKDKGNRPSKPSERTRNDNENKEETDSIVEEESSSSDTKVNRDNNFKREFNVPSSKNNTLYYVLYFLESATIGGTSVFLVYNNKKEDKKTKIAYNLYAIFNTTF